MHNMNVTIQEIENGVVLNISYDGMYPGLSYYYSCLADLLGKLDALVVENWQKMQKQAQEYGQPAGNESILSRAYSQYNALSENEKRIRERIQAGEQELAAEQADPGTCDVQEGMKEKTVENWRDKMYGAAGQINALDESGAVREHTPEENKLDEQRERLHGRDGILGD